MCDFKMVYLKRGFFQFNIYLKRTETNLPTYLMTDCAHPPTHPTTHTVDCVHCQPREVVVLSSI